MAAHGSGQLQLAAEHFEKAAKLGGGCAVGMVMWGLTLRHGWGRRKDEQRAFVWLRKGVERALKEWEEVGASAQLVKGRAGNGSGRDMGLGMGMGMGLASDVGEDWGAVRKELVLALREVARGFMHGWGVKEDKKMGFNYFLVAAKLSDPESAQEVAFCYEKARGVKKDKAEAARWYRKAVRAGMSDVGLAWIWKSKYD
ncbi:HCP-like protein [Calocera cornea HHB12733]|uniref:HCP-like protein n=1 Tax=Calocera cornea HHB12733 TaxID=1353952 RepID=A0A165GT30_9BASI|nr:HCP-like protein [Calocera cornea HHB12733]